VDVSGGVEASDGTPEGTRKGIKDAVKITEFLSEVNRANQTD
jgi:phosphoribosylanthranilate isomerase